MSLPGWSAGCALPANTNCTRAVGVEQQPAQPIGLRQQQRRPLVGGEPAGEADRQRVRVEQRLRRAWSGRTTPGRRVPCARVAHTSARRQLGDAGPRRLVGAVPHRADAAGQQVGDAVADPRVGVHAVGDRADRHLLDGDVGPHALEHLAADRAVQLGDAVAATGQAQAHHGHVEAIVVGLVGSLADGHQLVERRRRATSANDAKYFSISSRGKRSIPAGTGV